jgi:hypothetical protein
MNEWRSQLLEVAALFRTKYGGSWYPSSIRLTLGSMGGAYPSEAWVDDILLISRTVSGL